KNYLVAQGVPADRIYTEGKGKADPIASNATAEGRAKNRRVELEIVGSRM
ncbi:MAG TPA: OmpA family protein, partial [Orrella sp.]